MVKDRVYMRADINRAYLLSVHMDADNKNHFSLVWMQIAVLGYADADIYIYIYIYIYIPLMIFRQFMIFMLNL
jgi:hypothetical protein